MMEKSRKSSRLQLVFRYWNTVKHISPKSLMLRLRREMRTIYVLKRGIINDGNQKLAPNANCVERLLDKRFIAAAQRHREIVGSSFGLDQNNRRLIFLRTGDAADDKFIADTRWNDPELIVPSDIDRCYFVAFGEQAVLVNLTTPESSLSYLSEFLNTLDQYTWPKGLLLTIPWQPYSVARRLSNLLFSLSLLLQARPGLAELAAFRRVVMASLKLKHLSDLLREDDLGFNHLATEIFAQCMAAHVFEHEQLRERRVREFFASVDRQVGKDGCQLERSATYQAQVLGHLDVLLTANSFGSSLHSRAEDLKNRMRRALGVLTHPDGDIALFNDSAIGDGPSPEILGAISHQANNGFEFLPNGGYYRLNGGVLIVICDIGNCGPDELPAHAHADFLSLEASCGKQRFIGDPGVATSKPGAERQWTRSSQIHNGPTFRGLEPIDFWAAFRVGRRGYAYRIETAELNGFAPIWLAGWHSGFDFAGGRVGRWVGLWSNEMLAVVDVWRGCENREAVSTFTVWYDLTCEKQHSCSFHLGRAGEVLVIGESICGQLTLREGRQYPLGPRAPKQTSCLVGTPVAQGDFRCLTSIWRLPSTNVQTKFTKKAADFVASQLAARLLPNSNE